MTQDQTLSWEGTFWDPLLCSSQNKKHLFITFTHTGSPRVSPRSRATWRERQTQKKLGERCVP